MKKIGLYVLAIAMVGMVWAGCGSQEDPAQEGKSSEEIGAQLDGRWVLEAAMRGGKPADMSGYYFEYDAEAGVFKSDLPDETNSPVYADGVNATLSEQTLTFESLTSAFEVEVVSDSAVVLLTNMRNFDFEFTFKRAE